MHARNKDGDQIDIPVQLSSSGIASVSGKNLFLPDGTSLIQYLPGLDPSLANSKELAEALRTYDPILIPLTYQACDPLKTGSEPSLAYKECLKRLEKQTDLIASVKSMLNAKYLDGIEQMLAKNQRTDLPFSEVLPGGSGSALQPLPETSVNQVLSVVSL